MLPHSQQCLELLNQALQGALDTSSAAILAATVQPAHLTAVAAAVCSTSSCNVCASLLMADDGEVEVEEEEEALEQQSLDSSTKDSTSSSVHPALRSFVALLRKACLARHQPGVMNVAWRHLLLPLIAALRQSSLSPSSPSTTTAGVQFPSSSGLTHNELPVVAAASLIQFVFRTVKQSVFSHDWSDAGDIRISSFYCSHLLVVVRSYPLNCLRAIGKGLLLFVMAIVNAVTENSDDPGSKQLLHHILPRSEAMLASFLSSSPDEGSSLDDQQGGSGRRHAEYSVRLALTQKLLLWLMSGAVQRHPVCAEMPPSMFVTVVLWVWTTVLRDVAFLPPPSTSLSSPSSSDGLLMMLWASLIRILPDVSNCLPSCSSSSPAPATTTETSSSPQPLCTALLSFLQAASPSVMITCFAAPSSLADVASVQGSSSSSNAFLTDSFSSRWVAAVRQTALALSTSPNTSLRVATDLLALWFVPNELSLFWTVQLWAEILLSDHQGCAEGGGGESGVKQPPLASWAAELFVATLVGAIDRLQQYVVTVSDNERSVGGGFDSSSSTQSAVPFSSSGTHSVAFLSRFAKAAIMLLVRVQPIRPQWIDASLARYAEDGHLLRMLVQPSQQQQQLLPSFSSSSSWLPSSWWVASRLWDLVVPTGTFEEERMAVTFAKWTRHASTSFPAEEIRAALLPSNETSSPTTVSQLTTIILGLRRLLIAQQQATSLRIDQGVPITTTAAAELIVAITKALKRGGGGGSQLTDEGDDRRAVARWAIETAGLLTAPSSSPSESLNRPQLGAAIRNLLALAAVHCGTDGEDDPNHSQEQPSSINNRTTATTQTQRQSRERFRLLQSLKRFAESSQVISPDELELDDWMVDGLVRLLQAQQQQEEGAEGEVGGGSDVGSCPRPWSELCDAFQSTQSEVVHRVVYRAHCDVKWPAPKRRRSGLDDRSPLNHNNEPTTPNGCRSAVPTAVDSNSGNFASSWIGQAEALCESLGQVIPQNGLLWNEEEATGGIGSSEKEDSQRARVSRLARSLQQIAQRLHRTPQQPQPQQQQPVLPKVAGAEEAAVKNDTPPGGRTAPFQNASHSSFRMNIAKPNTNTGYVVVD